MPFSESSLHADRRGRRVVSGQPIYPMASSIKTILNIVVVCAVCVWLLQAVGLWSTVTNLRLRG
jgi:hypothetical protein